METTIKGYIGSNDELNENYYNGSTGAQGGWKRAWKYYTTSNIPLWYVIPTGVYAHIVTTILHTETPVYSNTFALQSILSHKFLSLQKEGGFLKFYTAFS